MKLDPFYPIFDHSSWIKKMVPLGIRLVQLRIKDANLSILRSHIRQAKQCCKKHSCQLVINDYWQLAIEEGCDFIHLGQEDLMLADLKAIRQAGLKVGVSTHDQTELAFALKAKADYIALGPIYPTRLKKMPWNPQGLDKIRLWKQTIAPLPLVVIGGLTPDRLPELFEHQCDSAAVITDIVSNPNPEMRIQQWLEATKQWR